MKVCPIPPTTRLLPEVGPIYRWVVKYERLTPVDQDALFRATLDCGHVTQSTRRLSRLICRPCKRALVEVKP